MSQQVPQIGSQVHFVYGQQHLPAVVTDPAFRVQTDSYDAVEQAMTVFPVGEPPFTTCAVRNDTGTSATWHWPEA